MALGAKGVEGMNTESGKHTGGLSSCRSAKVALSVFSIAMLVAGALAVVPLNVVASNDLQIQGMSVSPMTATQSQRDVPMLQLMFNTTGPMPVMVFGAFVSYTGMFPGDVEKIVAVHDMNMNMVNDTGDIVLSTCYLPFFPQMMNLGLFVMPGWWESVLILVDISPMAIVGDMVGVGVMNNVDVMADQPVNGFFPFMSFGTMIEANRMPTSTINSPAPRASFLVGETIPAEGLIHDDEDGGIDGFWWSNLDGYLGAGNSTTLTLTTQGLHTLSFNGTDRCGAGVFAFVDVYYTRARFNGSWKDEGVDLNGDGQFEFLRVSAGVECSSPFRATLQGELRDPLGMMPITQIPLVFPPGEIQLFPGFQWVGFDFWGFDIYEFGPYPSYRCMNMLMMDVMTWQIQDEELDPYNVTGSYDFFDFQRPPEFTGDFGHRFVDDDTDGKWDWLVLEAVVNASLAGGHSWIGDLYTEGGTYIDHYETPWGGKSLPAGETSVEFWFDGRLVWDYCDNTGYSGNFTLSNLQLDEWLTRVSMPCPRDAIANSGYLVEVLSISDFERAPFFTGSYSDYGVDDNGDGAFDWLCIEVEVNVSEEGDYEVFGRLLVNGTPTQVGSAYNTTHLAAGVHVVTFLFNGYDICKTGLSGIAFDLNDTRIMSIPDFLAFDSTHHAYTTGLYDFSQFQAPPYFVVKDSFFDAGWDEDGDGDFDWLNVTFQVSVSVEGDYEIYLASLRSSSNAVIESGVSKFAHLLPGVQLVTLQFDGMRINELGNFGMYRLYDVRLYDQYSTERDPGSGAANYYWWTNSAYNNALFQQGSFFTGSYGSHGKDMNGNGRFEYLTADIGLNVTQTGVWTVSAALVNSTGVQISFASETTYLAEGSYDYELDFSGFDIWNFNEGSPYFLTSLRVSRVSDYLQTDYVAGPVAITGPPSYVPGDFEMPSHFTGNFTHSLIDDDGDGLAELLTIGVQVEVAIAGEFTVIGNLEDPTGFIVAWNLVGEGELSPGTHWLSLPVPGYAMWKTGTVQMMTLSELYLMCAGVQHDYLDPAYSFGPLDYADFAPMPGLTGNFASYGRNVAGDWHYEYLTVALEFNATSPGMYNFNVQMQNGDGIWYNAWIEVDLEAGLQWVPIDFAGGQFFDSGYNGTYTLVWVNANDVLGIYWQNIPGVNHETAWYNYTDFAPPSFYTGAFTDSGEDTNGNGLFDALVVEAEVSLAYPGRFIFQANLYTYPDDVFVTWATVECVCPAGVQTIEFRFAGFDLFQLGFDGQYAVTNIQLMDQWWNLIDLYDGEYVTAWYDQAMWEDTPVAGFPDAPAGLAITLAGSDLSLDWECADPDVARFNVYRSSDPASFDFLVPYDTTTLTVWTDPAVGEGTDLNEYYYVVRSEDIYGNEETNLNRVGKYPIALSAGWSLVSMPLRQQGGIDDSLASISGLYDFVQAYDSSDGWRVFSADAPPWLNSLDAIGDGQAFWISTSAPCTLMALGEVAAETSITLRKGWNMVGYPSVNLTRTVGVVLAGLPWDNAQTSGAGPYNLVDSIGTDAWMPGQGRWVHVAADCTMTVKI